MIVPALNGSVIELDVASLPLFGARTLNASARCVLSAKRCITDIDGVPLSKSALVARSPWKAQIFVGAPVAVSICERSRSLLPSSSVRITSNSEALLLSKVVPSA